MAFQIVLAICAENRRDLPNERVKIFFTLWVLGCAHVSDFSGTTLRSKSSVSWFRGYLTFWNWTMFNRSSSRMNIYSLKMNHLISQEWQEIGLRNFVNKFFDARALKCDTFWSRECFQERAIACSFLVKFLKNSEKWTCDCTFLEALKNSERVAFESPCIKEFIYKISKPYLLPFLRNEMVHF